MGLGAQGSAYRAAEKTMTYVAGKAEGSGSLAVLEALRNTEQEPKGL
jgi:hypothetical protein